MRLVFGIEIHPAQTVLGFACGTRMMNRNSKDIYAMRGGGLSKEKQAGQGSRIEDAKHFSGDQMLQANLITFPIVSSDSLASRAIRNSFSISALLKLKKIKRETIRKE